MKIMISPEIFERFPGFCRGVVVATEITNHEQNPALEAELRAAEARVRSDPGGRDYKTIPRVSAWLEAFTKLGLNPKEMPPAIVSLIKRAANGARLPFINELVCLFNLESLAATVPCGGDDLAAVSGDLCLRLATGKERYVPLGKPDQVEHPAPGEFIYCDSAGRVLCRAWCWRNSHETRLLPTTCSVAINIDGLPPVTAEEVRAMTENLGQRIRRHCGGAVRTFLLSRESPQAEFALPGVPAELLESRDPACTKQADADFRPINVK